MVLYNWGFFHQLHLRSAQYQEHPGSGLACEHICLLLANVTCVHGILDRRCVNLSRLTTKQTTHTHQRYGGGTHVHCSGHTQIQIHDAYLGWNPAIRFFIIIATAVKRLLQSSLINANISIIPVWMKFLELLLNAIQKIFQPL